MHYSRKAPSKKGAEATKEDKKLSSKRKAPRTHDGPKDSTKHKNARKRKHRGGGSSIRHIKVKMSQAPPNANLIQRVRARVEQQRISNEISRSKVAQCMRQVNNEEQKVSGRWNREDPRDAVTQVPSEPQVARRNLIEALVKQAAQKKNLQKSLCKSRNSDASSAMQKVTKASDQGRARDHKPMGVTTASRTTGRSRSEQEAIGRLLAAQRS